ncbi:hypothetical protein [Achromobacter veterisilvae]|uniref:hypothetical protein n=1 Tax=Achromobacter veterisilvae TaxID=2069367 RepID=UPI00100E9DE2|nr:hypothetical protein [Achromobacter veterisilvae]
MVSSFWKKVVVWKLNHIWRELAASLVVGAHFGHHRLAPGEAAWFFNSPAGADEEGRPEPAHVPGDTASPPAPGAIQIGPADV